MKQFCKFKRIFGSNKKWITVPTARDTQSIESKHDKIYFTALKKKIIENVEKSNVSPYLHEDYKQFLISRIRRIPSGNDYYFVANSEVARDIAKKITQDKQLNLEHLEGNPGVGLLSVSLLSCGVTKLVLYDKSKGQKLFINKLLKDYSKNVQVKSLNLFRRKNLSYNYLLTEVPKKIIGVVPHTRYLNFITSFFTNENQKYLKNTVFYLIVASIHIKAILEYSKILHCNYRTHCILNLMYDCEILGTYQREHFLPLPPSSKYKEMVLVKIKKKKLNATEIKDSDMPYFIDMLNILRRSRFQFIIPLLEQRIPECGLYLISKGFSATTQTQDLAPLEAVKLFNCLKKNDWYKNLQVLSGRADDVSPNT